ncbi:MAG TPA: hypothetical protein VGH67_10945 [Solirubrobacteraceae bacterium]
MPNAHQVGGINLPAAIGLGVMIAVFAASLLVGHHGPPPDAEPPDDDGRGGRGPGSVPRGPGPTPGGIPLDDAQQSRTRLRAQRPPGTWSPRRRPRDAERPRRAPARH